MKTPLDAAQEGPHLPGKSRLNLESHQFLHEGFDLAATVNRDIVHDRRGLLDLKIRQGKIQAYRHPMNDPRIEMLIARIIVKREKTLVGEYTLDLDHSVIHFIGIHGDHTRVNLFLLPQIDSPFR